MELKSEGPERVSRIGSLLGAVFLVGLLVLFNVFPYWVGVPVGPMPGWRFLPLLSPAYADHLAPFNVWVGLALALNLFLYRRRRWDRTTRWLELATGAVGAMTLLQIARGRPVFGPPREWLDLHGWRPEQMADVQRLLDVLPLFQVVFLVAFVALLVVSLRRLYLLVESIDPAGGLVREGLGDRGVAGTFQLFRKDAGRAFQVLDRDQHYGPGPAGPVGRFVHACKVVLRGTAVQLTPARRLVFVASMILAAFKEMRWLAVLGLFFLLLVELVDRIKVRDELELARSLQRDLLPSSPPPMPGWAVAHSYRTANAIGGDYHDFQPTPDGRMAVVIGDASGHGMAAALIMAIANATLKAAVDHQPEPEQVVTQLNRALLRTGGRQAFMTFFYGLLDRDSGRLDYVCAGHPFPLLLRAGGGILELGTGSLPLGMSEVLPITASEPVVIEPGDRLLLYSDGVPEALDRPDGAAFGFHRLEELLAQGGTAQEIHDRVLAAFDSHVGQQPLADDLTLVVLHRVRE